MSLKMINRFHQVVMVALLILAVALTTALVVAAEHGLTDGSKKSSSQLQGRYALTAEAQGTVGRV